MKAIYILFALVALLAFAPSCGHHHHHHKEPEVINLKPRPANPKPAHHHHDPKQKPHHGSGKPTPAFKFP